MPVELRTERLLLRPPTEADIPEMVAQIGSPEVYETTLNVPRPYTRADAEGYVAHCAENWRSGASASFSIIRAEDGRLIGGMSLRGFDDRAAKAEISFAIGFAYWGKGYATEAGEAILRYGFDERGLNRIWGGHFAGNDASGRVQEKLGFTREGTLRQDLRKDGVWIDHVLWAIIRSDWEARKGPLESPTLETERLRLRMPTARDAGAVQRIHSDRSVAEGGLTIPHPCPAGHGLEWVHKARRGVAKGDLVWVVELLDSGEVIGDCGLGIKRAHDRAMIGYGIAAEQRGRGYGTEAVGEMVRYALEDLDPPIHRVFADIWIDNAPSRRLLEKLGFEFEGRLRDEYRKGGSYRSADRFARVQSHGR